MTSGVEPVDGAYWNNSLDGKRLQHNGKLNQDQTKERAKLHAERYAYGRPTIQGICDHWFNKYGISISYASEKDWAIRNEESIIDTMNRMVEDGELRMTITDQSLLNSVNVSGSETAKTIRLMETKLARLLQCLDPEFDPLLKIGMTQSEYDALDKDAKRKADIDIARYEAKNKMAISFLPKLSQMIAEHKRVLLETATTTKEILDDSNLKKQAIQHEIRKEVGKRIEKTLEAKNFDPLETIVSEEDRKVLELEPGRDT